MNQEDWKDIELAQKYRLSLSTSPSQSSFRVLALAFIEINNHHDDDIVMIPMMQETNDGRKYIVGTNDEPGYMGGAVSQPE
jgi:hypothetical protein